MSDQLFSGNTGTTFGAGLSQTHTTDDEDVDFVAHYFGDKTPTEDDYKQILKGKFMADKHIKTLEIENKGLRKLEDTGTKFEELLAQIKSQASTGRIEESKERSQAEIENQRTPNKSDDNALTPEKIAELVQQQLNKHSELNTRQRNIDIVRQKAEEVLGRNYVQEMQKKLNEIGVSTDFAESVAAKSPEAFLRMIGLDQKAPQVNPSVAPPRSSVDTTRANMNNRNVKNYAYYANLRKTNPSQYRSAATALEMHKMAAEMGEDFYK